MNPCTLKDQSKCHEVFRFYDRICRNYGFPYSESTLVDWIEDLADFTTEDLMNCLSALRDRESTMPIRFNEIYRFCRESRQRREARRVPEGPKPELSEGMPMPPEFKEKLARIVCDKSFIN